MTKSLSARPTLKSFSHQSRGYSLALLTKRRIEIEFPDVPLGNGPEPVTTQSALGKGGGQEKRLTSSLRAF